ncbi:MAG: hypothetical protein DI604_36000 [Delftia acidovorans]|nr:MAG: hypothetical protein DI604_36000 [Delftia acidovorans]
MVWNCARLQMYSQTEMFFDLPVKAAAKTDRKKTVSAVDIVRDTLMVCLPPEAAPSFKTIVSARFEGKHKIAATLVMFDGMPADLHLHRWVHGWSHGWDYLPGGAISWEDGEWVRYPEDSTR